MKSGKQRRKEIMAKRHERAALQVNVDAHSRPVELPAGAVWASHAQLAQINTYSSLPLFYIDRPFVCRDCGESEVWTAKQQKWWYEIAKGNIYSVAIRCRPCRNQEQARKAEARRIHADGIKKKN